MALTDFLRSLEAELRLRGVPFDLAILWAFAEGVWSLAQDDPEPGRWADEFLNALAATAAPQ